MSDIPNRINFLREKAIEVAHNKEPLKAVVALPKNYNASDLLRPALENKLISLLEKKEKQKLPVIVAQAIAGKNKKNQLLVISQAALCENESWLQNPDNSFVKKGQKLNQIAVLDLPTYDQLLTLGNCFGSVKPKLTDKLKTAEYMIQMGRIIGQARPKIAVLAAVEVVYPQMAVTCDGAILAKMSDRGQIKNGIIDGPLSLDVAIDEEVARSKGVVGSPVAGQAEGFLVPNSETARGIWEASVKFAKAGFGSLVLGGEIPILAISEFDNPASLLNSVSMAQLLV